MTYTLSRGTVLLGRLETSRPDGTYIHGILIPQETDVDLRAESQMHLAAFSMPEAVVVSMPEEPTIADGPRRPNTGGGSFCLQPVTEDNIVKPPDELRLRNDVQELRLRTIALRETRYVSDVPNHVQGRLPAGAVRGGSYWEVTASVESAREGSGNAQGQLGDAESEQISP